MGDPHPVQGSHPVLAEYAPLFPEVISRNTPFASKGAVEERIEEADWVTELLVHERDQSRPGISRSPPSRRDRSGSRRPCCPTATAARRSSRRGGRAPWRQVR